MSNEVLIALITALSAFAGSIIGILSSMISSSLKYHQENKRQLYQLKLEIYMQFIKDLQECFDFKTENSFHRLTEQINKIKLLSNKKICDLVSEYYLRLIENEGDESKSSLVCRIIINEMRKVLHKKSTLTYLELK